MRVVELEARHVRVALRRKVTHASHVRTETDNVVVRCMLSDGTVGYGEGVPRDYVTGETIDSSPRPAQALRPREATRHRLRRLRRRRFTSPSG